MTREEAIEGFRHSISMSKLDLKFNKKNMSIEREIMVLNSIARNEMAIKALEQEPILDKIRAEIKALNPEPTAYDVVDGNPIKDAVWETLSDVLKIIDKYRESE
jgi:hypothetical protein